MRDREIETNNGITGEIVVSDYDQMQRTLRDCKLLETNKIIKSGITKGKVLEVGPGPGYLGLEWLKNNLKSKLYWLEISQDMLNLAKENAKTYSLDNNVEGFLGDATQTFPFEEYFFDGVFTSGSMHEWANPLAVINEIHRVLKPGGKFFIADLKRNTGWAAKAIMRVNIKQKTMKEGLEKSLKAAYLKQELKKLMEKSDFNTYTISENSFGLNISGRR